jgi:hypothetical protein
MLYLVYLLIYQYFAIYYTQIFVAFKDDVTAHSI